MLRTIYPVEKRERVYRVPLSGAGAIKCDVYDGNDPDSAYEVKCQETLCINEWWKQAVSQAGAYRTPVLVINQAFRPFYFFLRKTDFEEMVSHSIYADNYKYTDEVRKSRRNLMDSLAELKPNDVQVYLSNDDELCILSQEFYLNIKKDLYENKY